jgi:hypothetical protein
MQRPACVRYGAPTADLIGFNRPARHDQGLRASSWKAPRRQAAGISKRRRPRHRRSVALLARGLLASDLTKQPRASLLLKAMRRSRRKSAAQTTHRRLKLPDLDTSREVRSTRMEGEDAAPVRRRVARMTKARRGRDAPGFESDRQLGGEVLSVGPKRLGGESASVRHEVVSQCGKFKPDDCADVADEVPGKYSPISHAIRARRGVVRGQLAVSDPAEGVKQLSAGRPAPPRNDRRG